METNFFLMQLLSSDVGFRMFGRCGTMELIVLVFCATAYIAFMKHELTATLKNVSAESHHQHFFHIRWFIRI